MRLFFLVRTPTKVGHEGKWGCRSIGDGTTKDKRKRIKMDLGKINLGKEREKGTEEGIHM